MPSYWDILQSLGNECLMADRRLDGRLLAAEKFATFASLVSPDFAYPHEQLEQVWEDRLYVVEHNWGGTNGEISDRVKTEKTRAGLRDQRHASWTRPSGRLPARSASAARTPCPWSCSIPCPGTARTS